MQSRFAWLPFFGIACLSGLNLSFSRRYHDETLRRLLEQVGIKSEPIERVANGKLASECV